MTERENYIRNATFSGPEWIPAQVHINGASWDLYKEDMEKVVLNHSTIFPYYQKGMLDFNNLDFGPAYMKDKPFKDAWGCIWETSTNGIEGVVTYSPLENWEDLENYRVPDARVQADRHIRDWKKEAEIIGKMKNEGRLITGLIPHGFLFMRLQYVRGFENAMIDFALEEERLQVLIDKIVEHNMVIVNNYLGMGVDVMEFGEDLGSQNALFISPAIFKKWIIPAYKTIMESCKKHSTLTCLHSDGYIMEIVDDLIEGGVDIINPQDLCNGIDNLAKYVKGKSCIKLDIDRQKIIPYGSRKEIFELIEEEVRKLGDPKGGLEFIAGIYPPTPPENVDALCSALEKYRTYWWDI